jgi:hypothetical protein
MEFALRPAAKAGDHPDPGQLQNQLARIPSDNPQWLLPLERARGTPVSGFYP